MAKKLNIEIPLDEWVEHLVRRTARETAKETVAEHQAACPINDLKHDLWGNDKPGLKADVADLQRDVRYLKGCKNFFRELAKPVIAALLVAVIFWAMQAYARQSIDQSNQVRTQQTQGVEP